MSHLCNDIAYEWSDAHRYSPAPRHRRRIIYNIIGKLEFDSCLDAGCAQPYLLSGFIGRGKRVSGCDISGRVIDKNRNDFPGANFEIVDISRSVYPGNKKFDLVISSEVLEHIADWQGAIRNLALMSGRYLLITVPSGKIYNIDRLVGHLRHYQAGELKEELEKNGFTVIYHKRWGAPFHSLYKYLINAAGYKKTYERFALRPYGPLKRLFSDILYVIFYFNDIFCRGSQLFMLAERNRGGGR
ncbi:MAG: class I SAM-dependent methyltransferase [Candidatus Omnitrophota bacterium]|jgi:trans-aconitate methyltransferase